MNQDATTTFAAEVSAAQRIRDLLIADAREKFAATQIDAQQEQDEFAMKVAGESRYHAE